MSICLSSFLILYRVVVVVIVIVAVVVVIVVVAVIVVVIVIVVSMLSLHKKDEKCKLSFLDEMIKGARREKVC